jgi:hypothetical protein
MADVQQTQVLPAPFIEAAGKTYLDELTKAVGGIKELDVSKLYGPQFVAGPGALTTKAETLATGLGGYEPYLQTAAGLTGPSAYQAYMSPYQKDIIDTTLQQYDIQAQKGLGSIAQKAYTAGAFGGAREGVAQAEYQAQSDLNRAALQAQLLGQGFTQAQNLAQQDYLRNIQLAQQTPALLGQQISALSGLGAGQQAAEQAQLQAQQQLAYQQAYQPLQAVQTLGSGITGLIAGYPQKDMTTTTTTPAPSALGTGLGVASTLAGIYGALR